MAFHEIRFPESISYGSRGGPGFSTSLVESVSGSSERVARWSDARRHYNAKPGIKTLDALSTTLDFYIARSGPVVGFRWKDWMDFTTATNHRSAPTAQDVLIKNATGTSGQFQLRTKYVSGGITTYRTIRKPVLDTVLLATNGTPLSTTNYAVDYATGLVTVSAGLTNGHPVTCGCEFDVPVQFAGEMDDTFDIAFESFNWADIPDIFLVEMVGDVTSPDRFYTGGSSTVTTASTLPINFTYGRTIVYTAAGAATWLLPDPTDLELGGPYFYIYNFGASTITLKTFDNVTTIGSGIAAAKIGILSVYFDGSVNKWAVLSS